MNDQPIGIFDSGLGGLTALKALKEKLPSEDFIYLGDTARLPYGNKSPRTLKKYLEQNVAFLTQQNVKAVVVACNSASSILTPEFSKSIPILGVIEPGAKAAHQASALRRIGVIATSTTVNQRAYVQALTQLDDRLMVYQQACPLLVPLVEEGWQDDPLTNLVIYRYLTPLLENAIDTLIMGCTHYPMLRPAIEKVTGPHIQLIDPGAAVADELTKVLENSNQLKKDRQNNDGKIKIYTTDVNKDFETIAQRFLSPIKLDGLEQIDLNDKV